jgi:hypothetical protein
MSAARRLLVTLAVLAASALAVVLALRVAQVEEYPAYEEIMPTFPEPAALPPPELPGFRFAHPRLPAPSAAEIAVLRASNPRYLEDQRKRAGGGAGEPGAVALMAFVEPGSQALDPLHAELMARGFGYRANGVLEVAFAYDWLHGQWQEAQRQALARRLLAGCRAAVTVVREQRLSPYNVYLYNRPLQSLMACSLALYGDLPEAGPIMSFTQDLWKNRVLPVWRQVMGANGGWHEGGEYVGLGIGQGIWQLPAMWRSATGEDLFAAEPGIRGFLDFLVYRTQPDGTHFRWGDGKLYNKSAADQLPLALEYADAAAYTLGGGPKKVVPSRGPWAPLTRPELLDPKAVERLPRARLFDGLGLVVARSDWTPQATYVSFKAGDNYWSHSHLDQGSFAVFRHGPLAVDSGLGYGGGYASDHHLSYSYQTIAHNAITVTDPEDTVPLPGKRDSRAIANDGGQRRIGSGWGIEPGPLDLDEWLTKRETYHTGKLARTHLDSDLVVAVADVTPAYTNALSGRGTFSHRTRRVEALWRTFGYDPVDDVIVVHDRGRATRAELAKRWLLHSVHEPVRMPGGFRVAGAAGRGGGPRAYLHATVVAPAGARVATVGGPGRDFLVDGRNYGQEGKRRGAENASVPDRQPGGWRVELSPASPAQEDEFLVVLVVSDSADPPPHRVRRLEGPEGPGVEVAGPRRTLQWRFPPDARGVRVRVATPGPGEGRTVDVTVP